MLFERFEVEGLSHYSYAVGCQGARRLAIVDPERNIHRYVEFARRHGMRISHVLETHIHADYASGARQLAEATGAELCVSAYDVGETFTAAFPHRDLRDGDAVELGHVRIQALHTPGHTPEHMSFLVFDGARSRETPILMLSGDFIFVGSLGRPDLLGEEQKRGLAKELFASVTQRIAHLPDGVEIHPAHGAGSMCGAGMSGRPSSTLGYERATNPYFDPTLDEATFVEKILSTVPPFPAYYRRMKGVNAAGATDADELAAIPALDADAFGRRLDEGAVVVDLRGQRDFAAGHVPGSFGIGIHGNLAQWASWVVPYDVPLLLIADDDGDARYAAGVLRRVGLDQVVGRLDGGVAAWRAAGRDVATFRLIEPEQAHQEMQAGSLRLLDVRADGEWARGHAEGAIHIMGGFLPERAEELGDKDAPIAVVCAGGYRSVVGASVLERHGFTNIADVAGGMSRWQQLGLPLTTGEPACAR